MNYLSLILALGLLSLNISAQVSTSTIGDNFRLEEIKKMDGTSYSLEDAKGKVLILNFWNVGCKGCLLEQPFLNTLVKKFEDKNVLFWSVTMNVENMIGEYLKKHPIDWEIKGGVDFMGLTGDKTFEIKCMPTTILVDREGTIQYFDCGPIMEGESGNKFIELINQSLVD